MIKQIRKLPLVLKACVENLLINSRLNINDLSNGIKEMIQDILFKLVIIVVGTSSIGLIVAGIILIIEGLGIQ